MHSARQIPRENSWIGWSARHIEWYRNCTLLHIWLKGANASFDFSFTLRYCERQWRWFLSIFAELPPRSSPPMGLRTFWCVGLSISLKAIGNQLPLAWEIAHVGLRLVQKVVLTPVVSLIHTSKARGTRHKETSPKSFLQLLGLHNCPSQTRKDNSIYTCCSVYL